MPQPYAKPGAAAGHTDPPWKWKDDVAPGYYELEGSDRANYTCSEYLSHKLQGTTPDPDLIDRKLTPEETEDWLKSRHYAPRGVTACEGAAPDLCGCGPGKQTNCVVIYRDRDTKSVFHVAALDSRLCDWGGKLSATGKIVRFAEPGHYCSRLDSDAAGKTEMLFYCKADAAPYVSDDAIDRGARRRRWEEPARWGWLARLINGILIAVVLILLAW